LFVAVEQASTVRFSLLVLESPDGAASSASALQFAEAIVDAGHALPLVFFHDDGVLHGAALATYPQDEQPVAERWAALASKGNTELVVCVGSALRRGLLDHREAARRGAPGPSLHVAFLVGGLGELVEAALTSDRMITFAG
jgi:tRNA 2-thiouridine synthesizing protein D